MQVGVPKLNGHYIANDLRPNKNRVVRSRLALMLIIIVGTAGIPKAFAVSPKVGSSCQKLNQVQIVKNMKFTCVKTGKKYIWKSTILKSPSVPKPSPSVVISPSASPTPTPTSSSVLSESTIPKPTPTQSPTEVPIDPPIIYTFAELPDKFKSIKYWAWKKTWAQIDSKPVLDSPIEIVVGPNSKSCHVNETLDGIRLFQRVYGGNKLPKKLWILYADMAIDRNWIESKTLTLLPKNRIQYDKNGQMFAIETVNLDGEGVLWAENSCITASPSEFTSQMLHGYTHTIQDLQYSEIPSNYGRWGEVPRWLIEGGASWSQVFYNDNKSLKKYERSGDWGILSTYDLKFFQDFLVIPEYSNNLWAYTDKWPSMRAYDVGVFVCEMLIALQGPDSIIKLNKDYLQTGSFEKSFNNIYGMTWAQAQPYISLAAYKLIQALAN